VESNPQAVTPADADPRLLRVAVVVPVFNAEPFLAETLESICAQTRRPNEIIVVNDCSTDRSSHIARRFGVTVIDLERNGGPSAARNRGIAAATSDVIAFCDGDDIWLPEHLESVVGLLERFPEAGISFSRVRLFGTLEYEQERRLPANVPSSAYWEQYHETLVIASGSAVRKRVWADVGGFDESLMGCEDWEFALRVAARYPLVCAEDVSVRYRKHPVQMTSSSRPRIRRVEYDVRLRLLAEAKAQRSPEFVARMERALLDTWQSRLRESWDTRDWVLMRLYLGLHHVIPGGGPAFRRWLLRAPLMPIARIADRLQER
jgi:glycosyltransferase involved in cell wall biosynthesis